MSKKVGLFLCPKGGGYANGIQNATLAKIDEAGEKLQNIGSSVENVGKKFLPVTAAVTGLGTAAVKTAADKLGQSQQKLGQAIYEAQQAEENASGDAGDNVVDADYEEVKDDKKSA